MMRDNRSIEIKKILKEAFPSASFKVRIEKYRGGESIYVYTDALKDDKQFYELQRQLAQGKAIASDEYEEAEETHKHNERIKEKIRLLLKGYEHIQKDYYGEILSGGNTFLFIEKLEG